MSKHVFSEELFLKVPIIGIIRNMPFDELSGILSVYAEAGLTTIEITMNTEGATDMIRFIIENYAGKLNIGAGTVCTEQELTDALNAGAQFIVTPVVNENIIKTCVAKGIPIFPGAFTPTEIYNAWSLGAFMVKIFPNSVLGAGYIKDVKAPLNKIKLVPTGGVSLDNILEYKKAGADGYGMGSYLFDKKLIQEKNWEGLKAHFSEFVKKLS
ncbi:MAG TPA: bifunctional 4-hydroxy-2-oxoglutarate aldolase/2-dehydro-3-deoxy-phosphogluconate aldolase [Mucilaginibacter sp.]|jgi:2-dehydro-3-deoxyphosphogluconate aldolase/(4S)-4-hydroxy-2-oxoglutarate aldolase|nr:bifunctional 4-hydroxy-2-oxoglutarate aldolase/2-dehydro-3-deoxy-phosphogluconate aldolase [Mucilaginibacter sp.]